MNETYLETIKLLVLTSKKASLYSKKHPVVKQSINQLLEQFNRVFKELAEMTISFRGDKLYANDISLSNKGVRTKELMERFKGLQIDSITLRSGLGRDELEDLILVLSLGKKIDETEEKLKNTFLKNGFAHIKANVVRYEKVKDGQRIVSSALEEAESFLKKAQKKPHLEPKDASLEVLSDVLSGKADVKLIEKYKKDIIRQLINDPALLTDILLQAAAACGSMQLVFDRLKEVIIKDLASEFSKGRRKPDKILSRLARSIIAGLDDSRFSGKIDLSKQDLDEIIVKLSDELKSHTVAKLLETIKPDSNNFLKRTSRLLSSPEELQRLLPSLKRVLEDKGIKSQDCDVILAKLETSFQAKGKVTISEAEYEQLKNKAQTFDKTLVQRIEEVTGELKKKNKRLADEKERVSTVIHNLAEGLVVVDKQGKIVMINPAAEELLGIDKSEKIGKSLVEGLGKHQLLALTKGNLADEGGKVSKEIEVKSKDEQTKRILRTSTAVVENENGNTVGMVMMLSDVTRQRQVEKMKSDFVSHVSHELRTPIIAAQKSLTLLLSQATGKTSDDQNKFLNIANSNLSRLSRLINDILDFSKLESGKLSIKPAIFNLTELIQEIAHSLTSWIQDKQIELVLDLPEAAIDVDADRDRIGQVLTNLIGNALKFTPQSGKVIISCKESSQEHIQVNITDNGIGIEEKDLQRIFDRFEQVSLVSPAGIGGTGLGLYICKDIIQLHGGKIWVESEKDKGSTFSFIIPKKFTPPFPATK